jgi:class 3 adenylate cyclase
MARSGAGMEEEKLQEVLDSQSHEQDLELLRTRITILFSDIKGSTRYAEKKGDVEYVAMIDRHNRILFPVIEAEGGQVVKTIGDAILAKFDEPVAAVKAAAGMQRVLAKDREGREEIEQIHIRIGIHYGMGLVKDNDVFGDVVNAASRIEHQAEADQVLITDALLDAATSAGFECAKMGRADLRGKDEQIDLYAVAWSESVTQQLIAEVQARYEKRIKEHRKEQARIEEEFDTARDNWRNERRVLNGEIEELEASIDRARETARKQISDDLQSELRFQIEELIRSREQLEQDLASARQKFDADRNNLKAQIAAMEGSFIDAMERSNNPARVAMQVREQVEARLADSKMEWQLQWDGERKRLLAEIERLKKNTSPFVLDEKKAAAARRAVLEKLGKLPPGSGGPMPKTAEQWQREFEDAKIQWETEANQMKLQIRRLESALQDAQGSIRNEILEDLRAQYEGRLNEANRDRQRLEEEIQAVTSDLATERQRLNARIKSLEESLPEAQEAARKQALAELQAQFDAKLEEANRARSRMERKHQYALEEFEDSLRDARKQIAMLEEQLKEAKEAPYKVQRASGKFTSSD